MTEVSDATRLAALDGPSICAEATAIFGGFLRCEDCGHRRQLGNLAANYRDGWPRCCGYTMRWWTQRQVDAGEVPEMAS